MRDEPNGDYDIFSFSFHFVCFLVPNSYASGSTLEIKQAAIPEAIDTGNHHKGKSWIIYLGAKQHSPNVSDCRRRSVTILS